MKRYHTYKDSGVEWIGKVPEHWSALRLKWVCNFFYGESLSAQEREDGTIPVYGSNGIIGYHNRAITEKPCIIVGRKGSFGKVTFSEEKCYPIDTTYYIDCTSTKNYMRWLWYLLPLLKMDEFSRDSAVPGLNREDAYQNVVPLPSSYEQKQIAAYLDRKISQVDNLISKKQKLIELLKEERAAIINQGVRKKREHEQETIRDLIPKMESEGKNHSQTSKHLNDEGRPTLSGKGKWFPRN
jgi:type I restriction enzyme S subunit